MDLDEYLKNSLRNLRESCNPNKGVVSAGFISDGNVVYATSLENDGKWLHAERNALQQYIDSFGMTSESADIYSGKGFDFTTTDDSELQNACERLAEYFRPDIYGQVPIDDFIDHALRDLD